MPLLDESRPVSLVDLLDRVLAKGVVIAGDVTISVAEVDLVRLHVQLVIGSTGTLDVQLHEREDERPASEAAQAQKG